MSLSKNLAAEFDNYKKRMKNEQDKLVKYASENILRDMLPTVDNLERALEQGKKEDQLKGLMEGVELTHKSLLAALKRNFCQGPAIAFEFWRNVDFAIAKRAVV